MVLIPQWAESLHPLVYLKMTEEDMFFLEMQMVASRICEIMGVSELEIGVY